MTADYMAPSRAKPMAVMVSNMRDKWIHVPRRRASNDMHDIRVAKLQTMHLFLFSGNILSKASAKF